MTTYFKSLNEAHEIQQCLNSLSVADLQSKLGDGAVYLSLEGSCPTDYCLAVRNKLGEIIRFY